MTKLEEEILEMMLIQESKDPRDYARMAGIVAKKYIEKAYNEAPWSKLVAILYNEDMEECKRQWLKEKGIIE